MAPGKILYDPRCYVENLDYNLKEKAPRRNAVDLTAAGKVRSDYWHKGLPSKAVSRNHSQFPAIHFFPADGVGSGVALTECEYTEGIAVPAQSVLASLPPTLHNITSGVFLITWPGYQHLKWREQIVFAHPNGAPLTIAQMASQIAYLWRRFYDKYHKDFNGDGIQLGSNDISYNHLRLHQIWTNDGRHWQAEVSYIQTK